MHNMSGVKRHLNVVQICPDPDTDSIIIRVLRKLRICVHSHNETYFRQDAEVRSQFENEQKAASKY